MVDNGSTDGSVELVREHFPDVALVTLPRNQGFAGGLAAGIAAAAGDWIAVFNNDTTVEPDAVAVMLEAARRDPRVGSVAAQMRFADRRDVLNSAGLELDSLGIAADRLVGSRVGQHHQQEPYKVFGATGGAALFSRDMLDKIGGFDETFFAFFEDVDVAWRAQAQGWIALYAPGAVVYHHHSATARHGSPAKLYLVGRNRVRTLAKNATTAMLLRNAPGIVLYELAYVVFTSVERAQPRAAARPPAGPARVARLPPLGKGAPASGAARPPARLQARSEPPPGLGLGPRRHIRVSTAGADARLTMRSAIVHDWFQGFHGAERTVASMLDLFARDPDIFTFQAARELLPGPALVGHRQGVAALAAARDSTARARSGPVALVAALHAALLRVARPERLRARGQLVACLRGRREASERGSARLLLLHAHALRLDAEGGARAGAGREGPGSDHSARTAAGMGPAGLRASRRVRRHILGRGRADLALLRPGGGRCPPARGRSGLSP